MITVRRLCKVCAVAQGQLVARGYSAHGEAESGAKGAPTSARIASATLQQALLGPA